MENRIRIYEAYVNLQALPKNKSLEPDLDFLRQKAKECMEFLFKNYDVEFYCEINYECIRFDTSVTPFHFHRDRIPSCQKFLRETFAPYALRELRIKHHEHDLVVNHVEKSEIFLVCADKECDEGKGCIPITYPATPENLVKYLNDSFTRHPELYSQKMVEEFFEALRKIRSLMVGEQP